ncbi:unnamed protein product [Penicillium salamii]|uniref:Conserved oligomeric Golgi complex subunit 1 n=1 Tax=Penicillium salamii TaxID=1612424 RepID=A0A9W4JR61_9EURO|nr:unnamed protein product [Penicillium salamii]CAG7963057.1 unnamed protein product [Penicillium salamii]CAG8021587.1 unnamed protein product [Penicillium salamii]CAG8085964.1 unnamed protein product [Penicillium salamii]CAG8107313.1 unnamed protein product [Penicillium salamii]
MAPEAPDPKSLKSWHDAFQYPIPTVRRVEQELRRDISSNKEKLRAVVGTRYRDLVGTAETIVAMNRDIQEVETLLADVGRRCNPRLVERKHVHARQIKSGDVEKDSGKHAFSAQLSLLHRCTTTINRLLRRRASTLLIAKILVVSRLLHKTLSQHEPVPPFLDDLRNQLASSRRTVLKRIDKRLASSSATDEIAIESLAAYCLATSSSADDSIHHFHQVRLDVIASQLDLSSENIPKALQLFVRSLQISKVLRSRQFADVLSKLKARPLLADPDIQSLDGLEVELFGRWVAPEVKNFTPWIKLSELNRNEGVDSIKEWSLQAFERFSEGCQKSLAQGTDFSGLLSLRTETIELWLSSWGSTIIHGSLDVLERLRTIFNGQLARIIQLHAQSLSEVGNKVSAIVSDWESTEHALVGSLWDADLITAEYSNGAHAFKQTVADRLLGRDDDVSEVLSKYQAWLASIQEIDESIDSLRRMRWTDVLVGGEDDEDIDITPRLNSEDPQYLSDALHSAVKDSLKDLQTSFSSAFKSFNAVHNIEKATLLLRVIRLVRRDIPATYLPDDFILSDDILPELQELLAVEVIAKVGSLNLVPSPKSHPKTGKLKAVPGRSLWEGEPAIPVQPSTSSFKFLRRLTSTMDTCGSDLWDPSTVQVLKQALKQHLDATITSALADLDDTNDKTDAKDDQPATNGEKEEEDKPEKTQAKTHSLSQVEGVRDWKIQVFFDSLYLSEMLGERNQLADVADRAQKSAVPSAETATSIKKLAGEYWTRTELLFGLLADQ